VSWKAAFWVLRVRTEGITSQPCRIGASLLEKRDPMSWVS